MKIQTLTRLIPAIVFFAGITTICTAQTNTTPAGNIARQLTGEWRNQYVRIKVHNAKNDSVQTMEADTSNWEARLQMKPIRTHFLVDGTYYSEYRNLQDSIVMKASGVWTVKSDTLVMTQQKPYGNLMKLHVKIDKQLATFSGLIDFDGEGKPNDEYLGIQKKFK